MVTRLNDDVSEFQVEQLAQVLVYQVNSAINYSIENRSPENSRPETKQYPTIVSTIAFLTVVAKPLSSDDLGLIQDTLDKCQFYTVDKIHVSQSESESGDHLLAIEVTLITA